VINAAAAIYVAKKAENFKEAIKLAEHSIDQGTAMKKLQDLIRLTVS
jgi:anthranilate phosphoribosyltransferase